MDPPLKWSALAPQGEGPAAGPCRTLPPSPEAKWTDFYTHGEGRAPARSRRLHHDVRLKRYQTERIELIAKRDAVAAELERNERRAEQTVNEYDSDEEYESSALTRLLSPNLVLCLCRGRFITRAFLRVVMAISRRTCCFGSRCKLLPSQTELDDYEAKDHLMTNSDPLSPGSLRRCTRRLPMT